MGERKPRKMNECVCLCQVHCRAMGREIWVMIQVPASSLRLSKAGWGVPGRTREADRRGAESRACRERGPCAQSQRPGPHGRVSWEKVGAAGLAGPSDPEARTCAARS